MKTLIILGLAVDGVSSRAGEPLVDSWFTTYSGKYARIYATDADKAAGNAVSTWSRGTISQTIPARCGVYFIGSSSNWVYIRTSGLASHVMGPWYLNAAHTMVFPNPPKGFTALYRLPRTTSAPATKTLTGLGAIGYFVDGVAMFDTRDAFYWNGTSEVNGSGNWNRDAWVNESVTFDPGQAHQPGDGTHHYHANPIALRYLLGDHVDFNPSTKTYSESTTAVSKHSPILAWVKDGFPLYGPYGYANATNAESGVRRMISGFVRRDGQSGTQNLAATGRTSIPAWAVRLYNVTANSVQGPQVTTQYPLGRYMEDNEYLGDLGFTKGVDFDLDEYNGRFCVTPEFPNGTYAYFVSINADGSPKFPYNIGRAYYGSPSGGAVANIAETVTTNFVGGVNAALKMNSPQVDNAGVVTLTWSSVEGGTYQVSATTNFQTWSSVGNAVSATGASAATTNASGTSATFYSVTRTSVATSAN